MEPVGCMRNQEGIRLAAMVEELEAQGETELAEATREVARRNEMELMKLWERFNALNG